MSYRTPYRPAAPGASCTIGPSAVTGERCGRPAVVEFDDVYGTTYFECADHAPRHHLEPPTETRRLAFPDTGTTFRTRTKRRYVVAAENRDRTAYIARRTDDLTTARGGCMTGMHIFDTETGEVVS